MEEKEGERMSEEVGSGKGKEVVTKPT